MKTIFVIFTCIIGIQVTHAQLKTSPVCPLFEVDVLDGNVNKLYPKSTWGEIKKSFPCFTEAVETATGTQCAGVFFKDKGLYFYTERNYIEITENFKGKLSLPLMGASRSSLFKWLGYPKIKDVNWEAFRTEYGTLVLYYNKAGKVNKMQISSKSTETLKLCE